MSIAAPSCRQYHINHDWEFRTYTQFMVNAIVKGSFLNTYSSDYEEIKLMQHYVLGAFGS